ncbi:MAG: CU044_5270 family protein [Trebonia sp.]
MTHIEDPMKVMADLRPTDLERLARDGYMRHRSDDLARLAVDAIGAGGARSRAWPGGRSRPMGPWRGHRGVLAVAGAGLTAAAAVALVITTTGPSPAVPLALPSSAAPSVPAASSAARPPTTAAPLDAHAFLLGSANVAAQSPVTTGSYWYVKERDFTETWPQNKTSDYKPYYASTQETWTGATRTRTIVSEDLQFNFATPADKAKWQADGSPKLFGPSGTYGDHGPVTNDYNFGADAQSDIYALSMTDARNLPTSAAGLGALLHRKFSGLTADQRSVGLGETLGYVTYVFEWGQKLLPGPVKPAVKAAYYQLLASLPGVTVAQDVTDPLGRIGVDVNAGTEDNLIIDPATAQILDVTYNPLRPDANKIHNPTLSISTYPIRAGSTITATTTDTIAYLSMGWTDKIGVPAS